MTSTIADILKLNPCQNYLDNDGALIRSLWGDRETLSLDEIRQLPIPLKDREWALTRLAPVRVVVLWAADCAESVLHLVRAEDRAVCEVAIRAARDPDVTANAAAGAADAARTAANAAARAANAAVRTAAYAACAATYAAARAVDAAVVDATATYAVYAAYAAADAIARAARAPTYSAIHAARLVIAEQQLVDLVRLANETSSD